MIFSLYFPILLSLSLSFLLHAFKKHIHSFLGLATTFNTTNIATHNYILKRHHPISSTPTTPPPVPLPPLLIDDRLMVCTESIGFESFDDRRVDDDQIDGDDDGDNGDNNNNDGYEDDCWRRRGNTFPPPLSSLNGNGQPNFILLPVRKNGRLQLSKARINRPEILYATRQDGRLRLYLVPDQCDVEEQEECEGEEEEEELQELVAEEEETIVESESEEEVVEETRYEEEEDRVREWNKFPNERFRRCHELVNHHIHGSHHHLNMYGVSIA